MISYAQNGEDVVLARAFRGRLDGIYVDLGASDPIADSVTKHFYDLGWRGINVEPVPATFAALAAERPGDVNLNFAVGRGRTRRRFYEVPSNPGLSSFSLSHVIAHGIKEEELNMHDISVVPLPEIIDAHLGPQQVDFLKVDVEGAEDEVIESVNWSQHRPRVLVLEAFHVRREDLLSAAGYRKTLWDGINTFWVRDEDADELGPALSYPASTVLDSYDPWHYVSQILRAQSSADSETTSQARQDSTQLSFWQRITR
jgi:FkbM family methyltransferase